MLKKKSLPVGICSAGLFVLFWILPVSGPWIKLFLAAFFICSLGSLFLWGMGILTKLADDDYRPNALALGAARFSPSVAMRIVSRRGLEVYTYSPGKAFKHRDLELWSAIESLNSQGYIVTDSNGKLICPMVKAA